MKMNKYFLALVLIFVTIWDSVSQCSMCRAVLESEQDTGQAEAINDGIVYLMAFPYILVGGVLYVVYRSFKKKKSQQNTQ
ncbi:hypothetical protein [Psychroflexus lacisalsi]